jgi:hypothetical protein
MDALTNKDYSSILEALEVEKMEPDEQEETILELTDLVFSGAMIKIMEQMSEESKKGLFALEDKGASSEEITNYIQKHVFNSDSLILETLEELKEDILAVTKG